MKKLIVFLILVSFSQNIFSQVQDSTKKRTIFLPLPQESENTDFYFTEEDTTNSFYTNDTLYSNTKSINEIHLVNPEYLTEDNLLVFDGNEKLLIIESQRTSEKTFYFLKFDYELGFEKCLERGYVTDNNEYIILRYMLSKSDKKLFSVEIGKSDNSMDVLGYFFK